MTNKEREELLQEILDSVPENPSGRYLLAPRFGKTRLGIELIKMHKPESILWVTPSRDLADNELPEEFSKWRAKRFINKLTTTTWMSLNTITGHYDMIVLDEEQYSTPNNLKTLLGKTLSYKYLISMTGTSTKHTEKKELYSDLGLKVVCKMDIEDAVDIGILSNYQINVVQIPMSIEKTLEAGTKNKKFMTSENNNYAYLDRVCNQAIYDKRKDVTFRILQRMRAVYNSQSKHNIAEKLISTLEGRKLFFCSSINQAESLCKDFYHGKSDSKSFRKFVNGEIDTITMVNKGGVGATYKSIDHLVLVQADSDKNGLTTQKICRTLLAQKDYEATIWILCLMGTQDEKWVKSALDRFDPNRVKYINSMNL